MNLGTKYSGFRRFVERLYCTDCSVRSQEEIDATYFDRNYEARQKEPDVNNRFRLQPLNAYPLTAQRMIRLTDDFTSLWAEIFLPFIKIYPAFATV
jgi:hypothetical protein